MDTNSAHAKRSVHRSPSYPVFDLGEAIEKAKLIYKADKRTATTADVIASHIGYSAAKGPGGRAVSALKQYGLLEENAGKYRISDLGYILVHYDRDSTEWATAVVDAARRPSLFHELMDENPDGLPSDAALRSELLKRDFNPTSIPEVISIIRNTVSLATNATMVYNGNTENPMPDIQTGMEPARTPIPEDSRPRPRTMVEAQRLAGQLAPNQNPNYRQDVFSLTEGPVLIQWPASLSAESFEDVGDWLEIVKRKIGRSVIKIDGSAE